MSKQPKFDLSTPEGREQWAVDVFESHARWRHDARRRGDDEDGFGFSPRTLAEARAWCANELAEREARLEREAIDGPDDFGGLCPHCHRTGGWLNIGKQHWCFCHTHRVRWSIGTNLFSSWRDEDETVWRANFELIGDYEEVKPFFGRIRKSGCHKQIRDRNLRR